MVGVGCGRSILVFLCLRRPHMFEVEVGETVFASKSIKSHCSLCKILYFTRNLMFSWTVRFRTECLCSLFDGNWWAAGLTSSQTWFGVISIVFVHLRDKLLKVGLCTLFQGFWVLKNVILSLLPTVCFYNLVDGLSLGCKTCLHRFMCRGGLGLWIKVFGDALDGILGVFAWKGEVREGKSEKHLRAVTFYVFLSLCRVVGRCWVHWEGLVGAASGFFNKPLSKLCKLRVLWNGVLEGKLLKIS